MAARHPDTPAAFAAIQATQAAVKRIFVVGLVLASLQLATLAAATATYVSFIRIQRRMNAAAAETLQRAQEFADRMSRFDPRKP